ncbi:MAG: pilus assembly protein PilP [Pseudomonadales bacterium]|nr:pilus assembly protein PilP [Pseudomonadales bacterium]
MLRVIMLVSIALLVGCSPNTDYTDLEQFMAEVDARPKSRINPLPPIETVAPFAYQASNKRSPFEPPILVKRVDRKSGPKVTPDFNRVKQFLEQYNIGQLAMVGTLAQGGSMFALIKDSDGGVHRVVNGDFMGTDHGRVQVVDESEIELIEIVPDGTGGWVERTRTVALAGGA